MPSSAGDALAETTSLCPTCLERVPGEYRGRDGGVYLDRTCPEHGDATARVWDDREHWAWVNDLANDDAPDPRPDGDFTVDHDHACLAVVEVTEDCNLSCSFCFASSGPGGRHRSDTEIDALLDAVVQDGEARPIQFSGGEPTVRDDLPELVGRARARGIEHVQVNTNGIRLATEDGYAQALADAGVTAIYLQFDGLEPATYEAIREVDLVAEKRAAVEACREAGLSVVLVPTVVPGTNDHELGDIVEFAVANADVVESVNFQPVAHFGRYAQDEGRFSLDRAAAALADQIPAMDQRDLLPVPCCSSTCQLASAVATDDDGQIFPMTELVDESVLAEFAGMVDEADWMDLMASTAAGAEACGEAASCCGGGGLGADVAALFDDVVSISITGFMDSDAADAGKLSNCCVSVPTPDGDLVPFCAYNMTDEDGAYALRNRNDWGGRESVDGEHPPAAADGGTPCGED